MQACCRDAMLVPRLELSGRLAPMHAPLGVVFSTRPELWVAGGGRWVVKSGLEETVAELVAHELAKKLKLPTPAYAWAENDGQPCFCSCLVDGPRDVSMSLRRLDTVMNVEMLAQLITLDAWIVNHDRNMGGLISRSAAAGPPGATDLLAIDFEKSTGLRVAPFTSSAQVPMKDLWPSGELGNVLAGKVHQDDGVLNKIMTKGAKMAAASVRVVRTSLGEQYHWSDASEAFLVRRAGRIRELVTEVWR